MFKISVLTPTFNAERFIERAITSVQAQNYPATEHVIMDGGSSDSTVDILKRHPHLIWKSEKDKGQAHAMNKAFHLSSGDIVVCLNADDYFEEGIFARIAEEFRRQNNVDVLVGNGTRVSPQGRTGEWRSEASYDRCLQFYNYQFPVNPVSYFYKRTVQEKILYNVHNHYAMDYEFLLRAFQLFNIKKIEQNFGYFYQDGTNKTANMSRAYQSLKRTLLVHCFKYDAVKLPSVMRYFLKKKLLGLH